MSDAIPGYGTGFFVEDAAGSDVFVEMGEVTEVTPPDESTEQIDVTHMKSPGRTREFAQGMIDAGQGSFGINWIPGNPTDVFLRAWRASGETRACRIDYPNDTRDTFPAFITGVSKTMPVADKLAATINLKIAGEVVFGPAV